MKSQCLGAAGALVFVLSFIPLSRAADDVQHVEGFDKIEFCYNTGGITSGDVDFRGKSKSCRTASWWAAAQMRDNYVSWNTATIPEEKRTTFSFIANTSVLPSEFTVGPKAKLFVNDKEALTFTIGVAQDRTWTNGDFELKYTAKSVEYPSLGLHRQIRGPRGNSGIWELTVPASATQAGKSALIKVEIEPFELWHNGWFAVKERRDVLTESPEALKGEIDALRENVNALSEQVHILATRSYADMLGEDQFHNFVIYTDGYHHLHPADLIKLNNGEVLLLTREGTEHISNDGDVISVRSKDGGLTWGDRATVTAIKDVDEREGCGIQLKDGSILVGIFYNNLYDADGVYKSSTTKPATLPDKARLGAFTLRSTDEGHTWSEPHFIDTKDMPFKDLEGPTDAPIEMPDGSIVMGVIGYAPKGDTADRAAVMLKSTDKGQTWSYLATMADDPGGKLGSFVEPGIVRTKTGRLIAACRNHGPDHAIWVTHSDDDGKTWSLVKQTEMVGHPTDLIQLSDGRIMATYGIRTQHAKPEGVRACFSSDNGETWDIKTEVQIRKDFTNWDIGYPESLELPDGQVLTVYYYNLFGRYFIGGTIWKPDSARPK